MSEIETAWAISGALMYEVDGEVRYIPKEAVPAIREALAAREPAVPPEGWETPPARDEIITEMQERGCGTLDGDRVAFLTGYYAALGRMGVPCDHGGPYRPAVTDREE